MTAVSPIEGVLELMTRMGYVENALAYVNPRDDAGRVTIFTAKSSQGSIQISLRIEC